MRNQRGFRAQGQIRTIGNSVLRVFQPVPVRNSPPGLPSQVLLLLLLGNVCNRLADTARRARENYDVVRFDGVRFDGVRFDVVKFDGVKFEGVTFVDTLDSLKTRAFDAL